MKNPLKKLIMYYDVHKLKKEGLKPTQIGKQLGLDYRTVKKYLAMSDQEYEEFLESQSSRHKLLALYEDFVKTRLENCQDASAAQVHDWLKEHHENFIDVNEKTVFNFVHYVRGKHGIPKPFNSRDYDKVEELPYGKQAQVDLGEYNMTTDTGKRKKIYFFTMVLSRSRHKFTWYTDRPFTTLAIIIAHIMAFRFFGGVPQEIVYDQDTLLLTDENKGDLILTEAFRKFAKHVGFNLYFCRKSDPQSKGKIENVIRYIKHNFLRGRIYINIEILNEQGLAWLGRTANAKVHSTTKKIPYQQWLIEKTHLKPFMDSFKPESVLDSHDVRKDNTLPYKGNFYRVPLGTFKPLKTTVWVEVTDDNRLIIYDQEKNKIASHKLYSGKGKIIGSRNYNRDFSLRIDQLIDELSDQFKDSGQVKDYLLKIRDDKPRYIRDQLHYIKKLMKIYDLKVMNQAMDFCIEKKIFRATDLGSVAEKYHAQENQEVSINQPVVINTINGSAYKIIPNKSDISDYKSIMK